jgi:hypothetical protein
MAHLSLHVIYLGRTALAAKTPATRPPTNTKAFKVRLDSRMSPGPGQIPLKPQPTPKIALPRSKDESRRVPSMVRMAWPRNEVP